MNAGGASVPAYVVGSVDRCNEQQQTARWLITPSRPAPGARLYVLACIRLVPIGFLLVCVRVMKVDYHVVVWCLGVWHGPVPVVTTALIVRAVTRRELAVELVLN
jgi:hypothetical protein